MERHRLDQEARAWNSGHRQGCLVSGRHRAGVQAWCFGCRLVESWSKHISRRCWFSKLRQVCLRRVVNWIMRYADDQYGD